MEMEDSALLEIVGEGGEGGRGSESHPPNIKIHKTPKRHVSLDGQDWLEEESRRCGKKWDIGFKNC